jgi:hypothetical protein
MNIHLHIDRIVLDGVSGDPRLIEEALRAELTRLVGASPRGTWPESRRQRWVVAPEVRPGTPAAVGRGIAHSVHSGLSGERA